MRPTIYVSVDIESDGPIPGPHSMLSIGAAAFRAEDRTPIPGGTFEANLLPLEGATPDPETAAWWKGQPAAWAAATCNQREPAEVMQAFVEWVEGLHGKPVFVGYPASFDQMFTHWYAIRFVGRDPLGFSGLDIKTMAATMLRLPYRDVSKRTMPSRWFEGCPKHTHKALDDALGQGVMAINMLAELRGGPGAVPRSAEGPPPPVIGREKDGTPLYEGRILVWDRPHIGEVWERMGDKLTIIGVDPYGRSFEYERERAQWQGGKQIMVKVRGTLGSSDLEGPQAAKRVSPPGKEAGQ